VREAKIIHFVLVADQSAKCDLLPVILKKAEKLLTYEKANFLTSLKIFRL